MCSFGLRFSTLSQRAASDLGRQFNNTERIRYRFGSKLNCYGPSGPQRAPVIFTRGQFAGRAPDVFASMVVLTRYAQSSSRANGFSARARSIAHTERARVVVTRNPQQDRARASAPGASLQFRDKRPAISAFIFPGLRTLSHGTSDPRLSEESLRTGGGQRRCSVSAAGLSIEAPTPKKGGQEVVLWCGLRNEFSSSGFLSNRTESTAERP